MAWGGEGSCVDMVPKGKEELVRGWFSWFELV